MDQPPVLHSGDSISLRFSPGQYLCFENHFGESEHGVLASFSDGAVFRIQSARGVGVQVLYGEAIQLCHVVSGMYLQTLQVAAVERECFKLTLAANTGSGFGDSSFNWRMMPRYKVRREGDPTNSDDQVLLSAHLANHFPHFLHANPEIVDEQVNVSLQSTTWIPRLFRPFDMDASQLLAGSVLRFHHLEHDGWLACSSEHKTSLAVTHAQALLRHWNNKGAITVVEPKVGATIEKRQSTSSLWVAEHAEITSGFPITPNTSFRLRNLLTDMYLGVDDNGEWEMQSRHQASDSSLFWLQARRDAPLRLGHAVHLRVGPVWLCTKGMELASKPSPSAVDSFVVLAAAPETLQDFSFVWSRHKQLHRLREFLTAENYDMLQSHIDVFYEVVSDLARFCIASEGIDILTLRGTPLLHHQALVVECGTFVVAMEILHLLVCLSRHDSPHFPKFSRLLPMVYSMVRLTANSNQTMQQYAAHYVPLFQLQLQLPDPILSEALDALRFIYYDDGELIVSISRDDLVRYLACLEKSANASEFLSALCSVGRKGISFHQNVFLQNLPLSFFPKLRAAKFRERSALKMLPIYLVEIATQKDGAETWVELDEWYSPQNPQSGSFRTKFRFLRALTLGRNQRAIDTIRAALPFDCLLALLQSKLPCEVKRHVCEVVNRVYVDCAPNVPVYGSVPLVRTTSATLGDSKVDEGSDIRWKLKDFMGEHLADHFLLTFTERNPHAEQYNLERWKVVYAGILLRMLRKMIILGWYKLSEFPQVAQQLLQILSHSRPEKTKAKDQDSAAAKAKREIVRILDIILSASLNLLIDHWIAAKRSGEEFPEICDFVHQDLGVVSGDMLDSKNKNDLLGKSKSHDKTRAEAIMIAEGSVRHLLLELFLYDDLALEQAASRLLMRLHNQHKTIVSVLQRAVILDGAKEHERYYALERSLRVIKNGLHYDSWEQDQDMVIASLRALCEAVVVEEGRPEKSAQALLNNMGLAPCLIDLVDRAFKSAGTPVIIHEAYRLLYSFCFENHANQVVVRNAGIHIMIRHIGVSRYVVKCLYLAARTNHLVAELFTPSYIATIVEHYSHTQDPICLRLLAVLIQPTPQDKPLRTMQNQICGLLLHPQYNLFGFERNLIDAELKRRTPTKKDALQSSFFADPLDFESEVSPFFQLLRLLSACAEGAYRIAEQRCRDMVSAESILTYMANPALTWPMKASLLSFLDEVYLDSPSAPQLFQPENMVRMCSLLESIRHDIVKLASRELTEEKKQGNHSELNLYVIDVAVQFLSTLVNVLTELAPLPPVYAALQHLHETITSVLKDQSQMQLILSCPPEGWSESWTAGSGLGGIRARKVLRVMDGVTGLCGLPNRSVIPALDPALTELNLHAKAWEQHKKSAIIPAALLEQFQRSQEHTFQALIHMFSKSLHCVMHGADKHGFHGLKQLGPLLERMGSNLPPVAPGSTTRPAEMVLELFSSGTAVEVPLPPQQLLKLYTSVAGDEETRYQHNSALWHAIMRFLTREGGGGFSGDDFTEYRGDNALTDFLLVLNALLSQPSYKKEHHLQQHLNSMNLIFALMSIVCNRKRKGIVFVKALKIGAQMLHGRGAHHQHVHIQATLLDNLRTGIGKQFMHEIKVRLRAFVHKIDREGTQSYHTPGEVALVTSIVEFVQRCFEGHSLDLQAYLNVQGDVDRPVSLLVETGAAFDSFSLELVRMIHHESKKWQRRSKAKLHVIRPTFIGEEDQVSFETYLELGKAFLCSFTRACQAPYFLNRTVLSKSALKGADRILRALNEHRGNGASDALELALYEFWLALLEVAHADRPAIVRAFVEVLDVDVVFAVLEVHWQKSVQASPLPLKEHFHMSEECHNLFSVLALVSAQSDPLCEPIATRFAAWKASKVHRKLLRHSVASVEFMRNGLLNRIYFAVPDMFKKNHRELKDAKVAMLYEVNRSSTEEQLLDFLRLIEGLVMLGQHEQYLRTLPAQWALKFMRRQEWWRYTLLLCFIINILTITYAIHIPTPFSSQPYVFTDKGAEVALVVLGVALVITLLLTVARFSLAKGAQMFVTFRKRERAQRDRDAAAGTSRKLLPLNVKAALLLAFSPIVVYSFLSVLFAFAGMFWSPFFFAFHLLDMVLHFRSLKHVQELISRRFWLILATIANGTIIVYFFSVIAFVFHLPYEYDEEGENASYVCETMQNCMQAQFLKGFHKHSPHWEKNNLGPLPALYDQLMFFLVFVMHTITIGAVIIDSFGAFREAQGEIEEKIHHECFICGIDKDTFNFKTVGFEYHIQHEHSMWNYIYLKQCLQEKRKKEQNLGGHEQYLLRKFKTRAVDFFPVGCAMSLE